MSQFPLANLSLITLLYLNCAECYVRTVDDVQTFGEISGHVRPERVNKWPNSMTDI
jgi:hypothetical protein